MTFLEFPDMYLHKTEAPKTEIKKSNTAQVLPLQRQNRTGINENNAFYKCREQNYLTKNL